MKLVTLFSKLALGLLLVAGSALAQTDFWQQTNGPFGATITALATNPVTGDVFAAAPNVGVIRSTNKGASWSLANNGLPKVNIRVLLANNGILFAGTDQGVFRSSDHGASWMQINTGLPSFNTIYSLTVNSSGHLFIGLSSLGSGVFRSIDNGNSWTAANNGLPKFDVQALAINANNEIFAGMNRGGVYRSSDNGATWMKINSGLTDTVVVALAINASGQIFAGSGSVNSTVRGIFRSTDNGANWAKVYTPDSKVLALAINANGDIFSGTESNGVYRSLDQGNTWSLANNGQINLMITAFAIHASGEIFSGSLSGVFHSADRGANWMAMNNGLKYTSVSAVAVQQTTGHLFAGTQSGFFRSTDNGANWAPINNGMPNPYGFDIVINQTTGHIFIASRGSVYRSMDNGESWQNVLNSKDVISLVIDASGRIFAGTSYIAFCGIISVCDYGDVYLSSDNGASWSIVGRRLDDGVASLAISSKGRVFAGTYEGLYRSTPALDMWFKVNPATGYSVAVTDSGHIFMGAPDGIYRSKNEGDIESWSQADLRGYSVLAVEPYRMGTIFAGTNTGGVFRSTNNGDNWTPLNSGLGNMSILSLALHRSAGQIFAGSDGNGVFRSVRTLTAVENENHITAIPASFALAQNYPNPFNPATTIKYELSKQAEIKLEIFDMLGRHVRTLVNEVLQAGRYALTWDGRNELGQQIASGVYIYQLRAVPSTSSGTVTGSASTGSAFVQTRRMALVR